MKMLMLNLFFASALISLPSCNSQDDSTSGTSSTVSIESSAYTNDGSVAYIFKPQVDKFFNFLVPAAIAAPVVDFQFCITKMKVVSLGDLVSPASQEARVGLVDASDPNLSSSWGDFDIADGSQISELHFEVHKDSQACSGADYSVSYNGQKLNKDLEFKFKFSPALTVKHGDTVNLKLGVIAKALEDATQAGQFNDEQISNYLQINTIGIGESL